MLSLLFMRNDICYMIVRLCIYFVEQVRRTKISERMRKLQDLVPNMDTVKIDLPFFSFFSFDIL